ncbi:MAG TPA: NAD(P)-dependent oxidoreductase [Acidimicrobiia bacterium]|jgi:D-3-phosphoglycerate dehydrogenase|nr:NAD(P)-dependent oxidoreductase [Acidimicrobiia bacterium]
MRVLIADTFEQSGRDALEAAGLEIDYQPQLESGALAAAARGADVLVVRSTKVPADVFAEAGPLGLVIRAGAGHNTIDSQAAAAHGVFVANVPGKNAVAVAELTMGLILAIDRRIPENVSAAREGTWNKKEYSRADGLMGKTLGVVGLGQIGLAVAERAVGFGIKVLSVQRDRPPWIAERIKELGVVILPDLYSLLEQSDIVTLHLPASTETKHLVDAPFLAKLRSGSILINTSRGDLIDETALLAVIDEKQLRVGLDVFAGEPAASTGTFDSALVSHPRVYTTHHIGASTNQAQEAIAAEVVAMIKDYGRGIARNVVNLTPPAPLGSLLVVRHYDRVGVLSAVLGALREAGLNVQEMTNQVFSGAGASVASIHVQGEVPSRVLTSVRGNPDVIFASVRNLPAL